MSKRVRSSVGLGLALAFGAISGAQAVDLTAYPPLATTIWGGFYGGAHVGYGTGSFDGCGAFGPIGTVTACEGNDYPVYGPFSGWIGGGQIGYNHQWNSFVLGGEIAGSFSGMEHHNPTAPGDLHWKIPWLVTLTAHGGVSLDHVGLNNFMLYGLVGAAIARAEHSHAPGGGGGGCFFNNDLSGFVAGLGAQAKVTEKISIFGEWNHIVFANASGYCVDVNNQENKLKFDTTADIFKVGANFWLN
jgi:outer membrane immunogenic protein